ncbi:TPA: GxxExxY protein [Candidatus Uhrbacteria bacterium]|nr:GxxExxY protein [Candidatus Uhrbacteria bacterium]HCU31269.1 GxxExxY protein [Candidatus Uhrbacteria bacterium]
MTKSESELIYPEDSYKIVGCAYEVFNSIGPGHLEKTYEKALAVKFKKEGIRFQEQVYVPVIYEGQNVGKNFFDFLIDNKIVVELKCGENFTRSHFQQVQKYLAAKKLKLAILLTFKKDGVKTQRVLNNFSNQN